MRHQITLTLRARKVGDEPKLLVREFPDRETAEAQVRCIERLRRHRVGLPELFWPTVDGERWCLSVYDFHKEFLLEPVPEQMPVAS